jgi:hypothetical protein
LAWFSSASPPGLLSQGTCPCSSGPAQVLLNKITVWPKKKRRYGTNIRKAYDVLLRVGGLRY